MLADLAASFQAAVVDCLAAKALRGAGAHASDAALCRRWSGGEWALRERLAAECQCRGVELHVPPVNLCTDNAVMGAIAIERLKAGLTESLDLDCVPS